MSHPGLNRCTGLKFADHTLRILDKAFRLLSDSSLSEQDRDPQPDRDNRPRSE